jgi:WD40 repeat protein
MPTAPGSDKPFDLFVSYAQEDRAWVEGYLLDALAHAGVRTLAERAFQLGAPRLLEFENAVGRSRRTLLVLSSAYLATDTGPLVELLAKELELAAGSPRLIPVLLQEVPLPARLSMLTGLDATDPAEWDAVVARVCAELERPGPGPAERPACPYPGMVPFAEGQGLFFGRETETRELLDRLHGHPFLAVIGPSGSGKSSLVFAGLAPALPRSSLFGPARWRILTLRPAEAPRAALAALLAAVPEAAAVSTGGPASALLSLLVVDQFEASFALPRDQWEPFHCDLLAVLGRPDWYLVLTMRADFYGDLMGSPLWPAVQAHRMEVVPLAGEALREAIVKPAEAAGCHAQSELIERLSNDAAREPGALPFVQETLVLLWDRMRRRFLPLAAYEELGEGDRNGLQVAIARRADAVVAALPEEQQRLARRIFLRLVQFGEGRADTRRRLTREGLGAAGDNQRSLDALVDRLASGRLLTLGGEAGGQGTVDLSHEALLAGWPTLHRWVQERRAAEQVRRRLEERAREWREREARGQGGGGLLDEIELLEAERWREEPDARELGATEDLVALLAASRLEVERQAEERRSARDRELRQAQALADAERQRAEAQADAVRRLRRRAAALAGVLAAAVAAAALASLLALVSRSRQLAAEAFSLVGRRLDLAAVESAAAYRLNANAGTLSSLAAVVMQSPRLETFLHGHTGFAWSVATSADGKAIASANSDGTLTLWSSASRQLLCKPIQASAAALFSATFSPDSQALAAGGADGTIRLWDVRTCAALPVRRAGHRKNVISLAFSPDGRILASAGDGNEILLWDGRSLAPLSPALPRAHEKIIRSLAFNRDGTVLASGGEDEKVLLWRVATRAREEGVDLDLEQKVWSLQFSPVADLLAVGTEGDRATIFDAVSHRKLGFALGEYQDTPGHTGTVFALAWSPDGRRLATASTDSTIRLWDAGHTTRRPEVLSAHLGQINSLAWSHDGRWLVSGCWDRNVLLWNMQRPSRLAAMAAQLAAPIVGVATSRDGSAWAALDDSGHVVVERQGRPRTQLATLQAPVETFYHRVVFSPEGDRIAAAGENGTITLWDAHTRKPQGEPLLGHHGVINDLAYGPGGLLASAGSDGTVSLWDTVQRHLIATLRGHLDDVNAVAFNRDGSRLASASDDFSVIVWDVARRGPVARLVTGDVVRTVAYSLDGRFLVADGDADDIRLWDGASLRSLKSSEDLVRSPSKLIFSPSSPHRLASLGDKGEIRLWELPDLSRPVKLLLAPVKDLADLAYRPDGRLLAVAADQAFLLDIGGSAPPVSLPSPVGKLTNIRFGALGALAATGQQKNLLLWDRPAAGTVPLVMRADAAATAMALTSDGTILAVGDSRGRLALWDLTVSLPAAVPLETGQGSLGGLAFSPDDRLVATGGGDGTVRVWRLPPRPPQGVAGTRARPLVPAGKVLDDASRKAVHSVRFSPDGHLIASAGDDGKILLWDIDGWRRRRSLTGHSSTIHCLAFRPGGVWLASGGRDRQVLLSRLRGEGHIDLPGHSNEVKALAFSPDGKLLATASDSEAIMLWDAETGDRLGTWITTPGKITALAFTTGEELLSGGADGGVYRWDLAPRAWLAMGRRIANWPKGKDMDRVGRWGEPSAPAAQAGAPPTGAALAPRKH